MRLIAREHGNFIFFFRGNLWSSEPWEEDLLTSLWQVTTFGLSPSLLKALRGRSFVKTDCCHHILGVGDLTAGPCES